MRIVAFTVLLMAAIAACKQPQTESKTVAARYKNPVLDRDFPDPTVIRGNDGWFYAYATQTVLDGKVFNIQVARSNDLTSWEVVGDALPQKPVWADTTQDFWAPHVLYDTATQTFYMYYSGESNSTQFGKCIGVATSKNPAGPFVDKGEPLMCGKAFETIDPMAFDDPKRGRKFLYWGSDFNPIRVRELNDDRVSFKEGSAPKEVVSAGKDADYAALVEGAWVTYRNSYYYLYYSGDNCCGDKAHYAVLIARADNPEGPFTRLGETIATNNSTILVKNTTWNAPGHNSIITDDEGQEWIFYHAINPQHAKGRVMLIDKIQYKDGWPFIDTSSPSTDSTTGPIIHKPSQH